MRPKIWRFSGPIFWCKLFQNSSSKFVLIRYIMWVDYPVTGKYRTQNAMKKAEKSSNCLKSIWKIHFYKILRSEIIGYLEHRRRTFSIIHSYVNQRETKGTRKQLQSYTNGSILYSNHFVQINGLWLSLHNLMVFLNW